MGAALIDPENAPFSLALLYALGIFVEDGKDLKKGMQLRKMMSTDTAEPFSADDVSPKYTLLAADSERIECIFGRLKNESKLDHPLRLLTGMYNVARKNKAGDSWNVSWQRLARYYYETEEQITQHQIRAIADGLSRMRALDEVSTPTMKSAELRRSDAADLTYFALGLLWVLGNNEDGGNSFPDQLLLNESLASEFNRLVEPSEPAQPLRLAFLFSKTFYSAERVNLVFNLLRDECGLSDPRHLIRCCRRACKTGGLGSASMKVIACDYFLTTTPSEKQISAVQDAIFRLRRTTLTRTADKLEVGGEEMLNSVNDRKRQRVDSDLLLALDGANPQALNSPKRLRQQRRVTFAAAG